MTRFALLQAIPVFLANIQIVLSTPLTFGGLHSRDDVWPTDLADEAHDKTWSNFTETTERWSSYEAPTFNEVFIPKNEEDLSHGVSTLSFASTTPTLEEIWRLRVCGM